MWAGDRIGWSVGLSGRNEGPLHIAVDELNVPNSSISGSSTPGLSGALSSFRPAQWYRELPFLHRYHHAHHECPGAPVTRAPFAVHPALEGLWGN